MIVAKTVSFLVTWHSTSLNHCLEGMDTASELRKYV